MQCARPGENLHLEQGQQKRTARLKRAPAQSYLLHKQLPRVQALLLKQMDQIQLYRFSSAGPLAHRLRKVTRFQLDQLQHPLHLVKAGSNHPEKVPQTVIKRGSVCSSVQKMISHSYLSYSEETDTGFYFTKNFKSCVIPHAVHPQAASFYSERPGLEIAGKTLLKRWLCHLQVVVLHLLRSLHLYVSYHAWHEPLAALAAISSFRTLVTGFPCRSSQRRAQATLKIIKVNARSHQRRKELVS